MVMTKSFILILISTAILGVVVSALSRNAKPEGTARRKAVVVELFTSESCSSCPPADDLLAQLRSGKDADGAEVIPLAFHVDYWNHLGWKDRFSSAAFSNRQAKYAERFGLEGPYTPQMVVDGNQEFIGSSPRKAREAIAQAASQPEQADVQLSLTPAGRLSVRVKARAAGASGGVWLAVTEDNLATHISGGENQGHDLRHTGVVRDFRPLGQLKDGGFESEITLTAAKEWKPNDLRVVVFVQPYSSNAVEGAASVAWSAAGSR